MDGRKIADLRVLLVTYLAAPTARNDEALTRELVAVAGELLALADLGRKVRDIYPGGEWPAETAYVGAAEREIIFCHVRSCAAAYHKLGEVG